MIASERPAGNGPPGVRSLRDVPASMALRSKASRAGEDSCEIAEAVHRGHLATAGRRWRVHVLTAIGTSDSRDQPAVYSYQPRPVLDVETTSRPSPLTCGRTATARTVHGVGLLSLPQVSLSLLW